MAKPIIIYIGSVTVYAECPKCRHKLQFYKDEYFNFCPFCGERLEC